MQDAQAPSLALLDSLIEAVRKAVQDSAPRPGLASTTTIELSASSIYRRRLTSTLEASQASFSTIPSVNRLLSHEADAHSSLDMVTDLLGGVAGRGVARGNQQLRSIHNLQAREETPAQSSQVVSFLGPLADVVAQAVPVDAGAAALPVDTAAVASAIPRVAQRASAKTVDVLPLILPAVAATLGSPLDRLDAVSLGDLSGALQKIVTQELAVFNEMKSVCGPALPHELQAILDQVAAIVSAAANRLGETLCAIAKNVQGDSRQAIVPCSSAAHGAPSISSNVVTLGPGLTATRTVPGGAASGDIISRESPQAYGTQRSRTLSAASSSSTTCAENRAMSATAANLPAPGQTTCQDGQFSSSGEAGQPLSTTVIRSNPTAPVTLPSLQGMSIRDTRGQGVDGLRVD